jgi:hypothetical protein
MSSSKPSFGTAQDVNSLPASGQSSAKEMASTTTDEPLELLVVPLVLAVLDEAELLPPPSLQAERKQRMSNRRQR